MPVLWSKRLSAKSLVIGIFVLGSSLLFSACAGKPPLQIGDANPAIAPQQAVAQIDALQGSRVVWGGVIISSRNLEASTEIEVLSFPLDAHNYWPDAEQPAQGRFLLRQSGYLETLDYAPGRYLSVVGRLAEVREVKVGESQIRYPVIDAGQLHLWRQAPASNEPRFNFGFGLIFSN